MESQFFSWCVKGKSQQLLCIIRTQRTCPLTECPHRRSLLIMILWQHDELDWNVFMQWDLDRVNKKNHILSYFISSLLFQVNAFHTTSHNRYKCSLQSNFHSAVKKGSRRNWTTPNCSRIFIFIQCFYHSH